MGNVLQRKLDTKTKMSRYKSGSERCVLEMENFEDKMKVQRTFHTSMCIVGQEMYIDADMTVKEEGLQKKVSDIERTGEKEKGEKQK